MAFFNKTILLICVMCSSTIIGFGQETDFLVQRELWRTRADTITNRLVKESFNSDSLERASLFVELSDLWWEFDKNQSNAWIEKAVDTIYFYSSEELKANSERFFETARQILSIISNRNQKQSNRLIEILSQANKDSEKEKNVNADSLIEFALQIVKENPTKAAQIGTLAFRVGQPKEFYQLTWELRRYNPTLANQFFRTALSSVSASRNLEMLQSMQLAAFPENFVPNFSSNLAPPRELKTEFLNFLADYIVQQQYSFVTKSIQSCTNEAAIISRAKNQFIELLPTKSGIVQQAIDVCLAGRNQKLNQIQTQPVSTKTSNIDDLLKLADVEDSPDVRGVYLFKAALLANQQKKYALSIDILENMKEKEREIFADDWEELRHDSAAGLAYTQFKDDNPAGALETLKNVPDKLRPLAQIGFMLKIPPEDASAYSFGIEQLNDARRGFIKSELPFTKKMSYWLNLVKLYSNYKLQTEAAEVFKEIASAFNSSLSDDKPKANSATSNQLIADSKQIIPMLSPTLLETQENSILESVSSLKQEKPRIQLNLAFLKIALKQYKILDSAIRKKSSEKQNREAVIPQRKEN